MDSLISPDDKSALQIIRLATEQAERIRELENQLARLQDEIDLWHSSSPKGPPSPSAVLANKVKDPRDVRYWLDNNS